MEAVINTNQLSKTYGSGDTATHALDKLNLQVNKGEIFGYLGPNGAGKTTTIRLLLDLIRPTQGSATIFGQDVKANSVDIHKRIGFLPGELSLWKNRTASQIVSFIADVRGDTSSQIAYSKELAERLKFDLSKKVRDYSTGNRRKLGLILALMHKPELLILDEPTSGLDPLMQQIFNEMMNEVKAEGRTVFLSSHVLSEVQAICDRVGILRDGDLKAIETIENLTHVGFRKVGITFRDVLPSDVQSTIGQLDGASDVSVEDNTISLKLSGDFDPVLRAIGGNYVTDMRVEDPTLEEIFLAFYGAGE